MSAVDCLNSWTSMSATLFLTDQSLHRPLQCPECNMAQVAVESQVIKWLKLTCLKLTVEEFHVTKF